MYFADLTPFAYNSAYQGLNVGWIDGEHPFPQGDVPDGFLDALFDLIASGELTRCVAAGHHSCEVCESPQAIFERHGEELLLGNFEIAVPYEGDVYVAPSLVYHYVEAHQYLPPEPFVQGVIQRARA